MFKKRKKYMKYSKRLLENVNKSLAAMFCLTIILSSQSALGQDLPEKETKVLTSKSKKTRIKSSSNFGQNLYYTFIVGGGASYVIPGLSGDWADYNSGIGIDKLYHINAKLNVKITQNIGVTILSGKSFSGITKKYVTDGVLQYETDEQVDYVPLELGFRFNGKKAFYVEPIVGAMFANLNFESHEGHPFGVYEKTSTSNKFYTGLLTGLDMRVGKIPMDFSAYFKISENREALGIRDYLGTAGLNLGIGIGSKK